MIKFTLENEDVYIGNTREILSLMKNIEKRGLAINLFQQTPHRGRNRLHGLCVEYYSMYDMHVYNVPLLYVINSDNILVELYYRNIKGVRKY